MKLEIQETSNIIGFYDFRDCQDSICQYAAELLKKLDLSDLSDWTLILRFVLGKSDWVGVYTKGITYPSTKERDISIIIPIPLLDQASYGINKKRFLTRPGLDPSKFIRVDVDYKKYKTIQELIIDSAKKGIDAAFIHGIKIKGKTLKIKVIEAIEDKKQ